MYGVRARVALFYRTLVGFAQEHELGRKKEMERVGHLAHLVRALAKPPRAVENQGAAISHLFA